MRGPADAAKFIEASFEVDLAPRLLTDLIVIAIEENGAAGDLSAEEVAEIWAPKVKSRLISMIESAKEHAKFVRVALNSSNDDYVQGSCFVEPTEDESVEEAKRKRATLLRYVDEFEAIDPNDFELLCGRTLSLFQVEEEFVTRASADQGIDFFGRVPVGEILKPAVIDPGPEQHFKVWLVGQAKHYQATQVSTKDIRELVGSVALAKSKVFAGKTDPLSSLQMRVCDPVVYLFFTTGTITRDARDLLTKAGVVAMDGLQLAMFLADHAVGLAGGAFSQATFRSWLRP
jgi:hypothetical protein